ncbi:hypothetical protein LGT39_09420 [Demequina sp. TTPB684]|uniref:hypothetical protein n=1 Tax=unclassified Demequina TaxID=2620311 RepID=UPI001CF53FC9|nr:MULTISPECIES: hypothetical protein [unclassified Demequina]MCB2413060.1 hypothetical protein [Demequina sp. TTPB684]UPU88131.1 hypothetical protein LGT36_012920 [Demequina sp. TMPB413]
MAVDNGLRSTVGEEGAVSTFGGELRFGDIVFWLGHDAYLDMQYLLQNDGVFMFRGASTDGGVAERWSGTMPTLGPFHPDPGRDSHLRAERAADLDSQLSVIDHNKAFPLFMEDGVNGGVQLVEFGWYASSGG